jgi:hypothetical protein
VKETVRTVCTVIATVAQVLALVLYSHYVWHIL